MTQHPLRIYAESLLRADARGGAIPSITVRMSDGTVAPLALERYLSPADEIDEQLVEAVHGPVLDVGCGPGRHLHALARRGVFALGVDLSNVAVELARGGGANAIVGSIFDELPGAGSWQTALLLDGNIGIGGAPVKLLGRVGVLLAAGGELLVELDPPEAISGRLQARLEGDATSAWFPWARVACGDIDGVAASAGLAVARRWQLGGRWFALLGR